MKRRDDWEFEYKASELLAGCQAKVEHHAARLAWWREQKKTVMETIRGEGLSIDESIADREYASAHTVRLSGGFDRREPQVRVRVDLQRDLTEASNKIHEHDEKLRAYQAWAEVLGSQADRAQRLQYDDWLYFFGKTSQTPEW